MAKTRPKLRHSNKLTTYLQILYRGYFKPFSLKRWLWTVEPRLNANDNLLFLLQWAKKSRNWHLKNYASQILTLTLLVPLLTVIIVVPIYTAILKQEFNWFANCLFLSSWLISLLIACRWFYQAILRLIGVAFLLGMIFTWSTVSIQTWLLPLIWGIITGAVTAIIADARFSLIFGVGLGLGSIIGWQMSWQTLSGVIFGSILEVLLGASSGVALGLAWVSASGIEKGIRIGIFWGLVSGICLSLTSGLDWGVTWGVVFILGVLRFYFWLLELFWTLLIFVFSRWHKDEDWLYYLPCYFDELIILPLPFQARIIAESYRQNQALVKEIISYLLNFTNQQRVAIQAITEIALQTMKKCRTKQDIARIAENLAWLSSTPDAYLSPWLAYFCQISEDVQTSEQAYSPELQLRLLETPIQSLSELRHYHNRQHKRTHRKLAPWQEIGRRWLYILTKD